jgi:hypothetical protein
LNHLVPGLLFRSMRDEIDPRELFGNGDALILGDFLRCVGRVVGLRSALNEELPAPRWREGIAPRVRVARQHPGRQGEELAREARAYFGLGSAPVPSMRAFLHEQGIEVFYLQPGRFKAPLDGACTQTPAPAVLINPIYAGAPWSFRATMAHELCHLLHDRKQGRDLYISQAVSGRVAWDLFEQYIDRERRANAFAAHFLAPLDEVRRVVVASGSAPHLPDAALAVCGTLGTSYELAVNQVARAFRLDPRRRDALLQSPRGVEDSFPYDEAPEHFGLFDGDLRALVMKALARGVIDPVEARMLLGIPLDVRLPQSPAHPVSAELLEPLLSHEDRVMRNAWRLLLERDPTGGLSPSRAERTLDGWVIGVVALDSDNHDTVAHLMLAHDLTEVEYRVV